MRAADGASASLQVLLVEDNTGDVRLMQEAFRDAGRPVTLHVASDGVEAIEFLRRAPPFAGVPRPDLILLDLNMPRMTGLEVLAAIKQDNGLKMIPAIIFTTSDQNEDILNSYVLNANCFLRKPVELDGFATVVKSITDFWLTKAKLPPQGPRT